MARGVEKEDLYEMQEWLKGHGKKPISLGLIPTTGLVVDQTAMGFLYLTNSGAAWIENLVSNPGASATSVALAINEIVEELVEMAKRYGVHQIYALTTRKSVATWGQKLGFDQNDESYQVLSRRL
jgi:hypothetical protein